MFVGLGNIKGPWPHPYEGTDPVCLPGHPWAARALILGSHIYKFSQRRQQGWSRGFGVVSGEGCAAVK